MLRIALVLVVVLLAGTAEAGLKGRLIGLIAEYEEAKSQIMSELVHADELRKDGYSSDIKLMEKLSRETLQISSDADKLQLEIRKESRLTAEPSLDAATVYALRTASSALHNAIFTEFLYQAGQKSDFTLVIRAKYEDLAQTADQELKRLQALKGAK